MLNPSVSLLVVIPSHNRPNEIRQCLASVVSQEIPADLCLKVLVRENSSCMKAKSEIHATINHLSGNANIPICILDVSTADTCLAGDLNIFESIHSAHSGYVLVLPDDDFLLNGSIEKISRAILRFSPDILHMGLIEVTNDNSGYILRNHQAPGYDDFREIDFLDYDLGIYIGLQSFVYSASALIQSRAPIFSECSEFINWTCASQFLAIAAKSKTVIEIGSDCVAWRKQADLVNLEVRNNWPSINLFQSSLLLTRFLQSDLISYPEFRHLRDQFILKVKRAPRIDFFLKNLFRFIGLYGLKNTVLLLPISVSRTLSRVINKLTKYFSRYSHKAARIVFVLKEKLAPSSPLLLTLPLDSLNIFNQHKLLNRSASISTSSEFWDQLLPQFSMLSLSGFRWQKPVVNIMQGSVAGEKFSISVFLDELLACPVGTLFLSRVADSPFGYPPLRESFPLISSLTALHVWYWYKLCLFNPSLEYTDCIIHEFGGGFGNLARVILSSTQQVNQYLIYDFSIISNLQESYLKTTLPLHAEKKIKYAGPYTSTYCSPVFSDNKTHINVFIATFSISETKNSFFDQFLRNNLRNYDYALIAFQHQFLARNNLQVVQSFLSDCSFSSSSSLQLLEMWKGASLLLYKK